tara:strand:+ start:2123 stop:2620 length:498 start_codon:yes stop_codon:yes gene_type:complete
MEYAITNEAPATGYRKNANVIAVLTEEYPELKEVSTLTTLISARRSYMKSKAAGKYAWQKKPKQPENQGEHHPLLAEEKPSAVRPSMNRSAPHQETSSEPTITPADFHVENGKLKASSKTVSIQNWTMHSATFTNINGSVITIQLDDSSATLSNKGLMNIIKNIL